jgi:hypothetical protein
MTNPHAQALGRLGGRVRSPAKAAASAANGRKAAAVKWEVRDGATVLRAGLTRGAAWALIGAYQDAGSPVDPKPRRAAK